ncbi:MAG: ArsR/SmtB family transcription factor, partial [Chloroflexota bacterium]
MCRAKRRSGRWGRTSWPPTGPDHGATTQGTHVSVAVTRLDRTLEALAEPERRRTIEILRQGPRRAGELAAALELPAPSMSRHLRR